MGVFASGNKKKGAFAFAASMKVPEPKAPSGPLSVAQRQISNYNTRLMAAGVNPNPPESFWQKAKNAGLKTLGYGLQGLELLTRPWNAVLGAGVEGARNANQVYAEGGSSWNSSGLAREAKAIGSGLSKGFQRQEDYHLSELIHRILPVSQRIHPLRWLIDPKNDMWAPRTPEQAAQYAALQQQYDEKHPTIAKLTKAARETAYNADLGDILGLAGEFRAAGNLLPSIGGTKMVPTQKVVAGSGKTLKMGSEAANLERAYAAAPEAVAALPAPAQFTAGAQTVPIVRRFRLADPTQRLSKLFGDIGQEATDIYNAARTPPVAGRKELVEYVYKGLGGEASGIAKREVQRLDLGRLQELAKSVTETGPRPTIEQIASDLARQRGINLEQLLQDVSNPPTLREALFGAAERSRLGRAAGVVEKPSGVRRLTQTVEGVRPIDYTPSVTVSEGSAPSLRSILDAAKNRANPRVVSLARRGAGMTFQQGYKEVPRGVEWFGQTLVSGEKLNNVTNALTAPIRGSKPYQTLAPLFSRRVAMPGTNAKALNQAVDLYVLAKSKGSAQAEEFAKQAGKALQGVSDEELKLVTHALDQGLDLSSKENVARLVKDAGLKLNAKSLDLAKLKRVQDYASQVFRNWGAEEKAFGILKETRNNYVTHLIDTGSKEYKALLSQAAKRGAKFSENHPFQTRELDMTLAELKRAGVPLKTENLRDILAVRGQAHYRSVSNHQLLEDLKKAKDLVRKGDAPAGWVAGETVAPQFAGYQVDPSLARFIKSEMTPVIGNEDVRQFLFNFYDRPMSVFKTLVTRVSPGFHGRNAVDNAFKNFLGGVSARFSPVAAQVERGASGVFKTKSGKQFTFDEIRRLANESGLQGTGWFGSSEDIANTVRKVAGTAQKTGLKALLDKANPGQIGQRVGNFIEGHAKMTHFLDKLWRYDDPVLAAKSANRFLFNYGDLTPFEREIMRRLFPFYTFTRKNVPLMFQQLLENPGKFAQLQVAKNAVEGQNRNNVDENLVPDYLKQQFTVTGPVTNGVLSMFVPGLSVSDLQKPLRPAEELWQMLTPAAKVPIGLMTNTDSFGSPIDRFGGQEKKPVPGYVKPLADLFPNLATSAGATKDANGNWVIPARAKFVLDSLVGGAPRDIGKMIDQGSAKPLLNTFLKEIDLAKQKKYLTYDERDRLANMVSALRAQGFEVPTIEELFPSKTRR